MGYIEKKVPPLTQKPKPNLTAKDFELKYIGEQGYIVPVNRKETKKPKNTGRKDDAGKDRWDLLTWEQIVEVVKVLTDGALEYGDDNWQRVPNAKRRYFAAMMRHIDAWKRGELQDKKSGHHPLAHAVCSALFLMWFDANGGKDGKK